MVAQLVGVEVVAAHALADAGAKCRDQRQDFIAGQQLLVARLLHVQDLAAQGQDRLELAVAALLGAAACGVALDDVDLAQRGVFFLAVGQLAGQAHAVEHALAARHFARLAGGFAGLGGFDDLAADDLGVGWVFKKIVGQCLADHLFHRAAHFAGHQLVLGLAAELGLGHLHAQHTAQAFAHVVAGDFHLGLLGQLGVFDVLVDHARHRRAQAGQVGATVALRDVVGEAQHALAVAVVPLHGHVGGDGGALLADLLALCAEDGGVQHLLAGVDELHEALHAAGVGKGVFLVVALVDQADLHAVVQEAQLAQLLGDDVVVEIDVREDFQVGQKVHFGAAFFGLASHPQGRHFKAVTHLEQAVLRNALLELHEVGLAIAAHCQAQPLAQAIDAAHAHAVQPARDLVAVLVELATGMQLGQRDLGRTALGLVLVVHLDAGRNASAVVGDADGVVGMDGHDDVVAMPGQRFVDRVVDHLEHQVVQAGAVGGVSDVHARALAHRFEPFEDLDAAFTVSGALRRIVGGFGGLLGGVVGRNRFTHRWLQRACRARVFFWLEPPAWREAGGSAGTASRTRAAQQLISASASRRT